LRCRRTGTITFYMKGADTRMTGGVLAGDCSWLDETCQETACKGLRTLVFGSRVVSQGEFDAFMADYKAARSVMGFERAHAVARVLDRFESELQPLCITGVEDTLQEDVTVSLETLGMCGIRVWMLTGDKVETAVCIARSAQLVPRNSQVVYVLSRDAKSLANVLADIAYEIDIERTVTMVVDGTALEMCLGQEEFREDFVRLAVAAHSVVIARCSPTQKADVVKAVMQYMPPDARTAAIGDGGNDVSMIQAAHVGIGIEGLEGKQAAMAADFSILQFKTCVRLIMWHGRNSYQRTCNLCQFIMHRGIVYSIVQATFSLWFAGCTMMVFNGYLLIGYTTVFTMAPVFALVLDEDYEEEAIPQFPQVYKELLKGRSMNIRSFLQWVWVSIFQGGMMMYMTLILFETELFRIVDIAFTALLFTEWFLVAAVFHFGVVWHQRRLHLYLFVAAEVFSILCYITAIRVLPNTFDKHFILSNEFAWKLAAICMASTGPVVLLWMAGRFLVFRQSARTRIMLGS
jgi:phospholipid-translocating ATPase